MGAAIPPLLLRAFLMQNNCGFVLYTYAFIYLRRSLCTRFECVVHIWIPGIHAFINLKAAQKLSHCKKYLDVCHLAQSQEFNGIHSYAEETQW